MHSKVFYVSNFSFDLTDKNVTVSVQQLSVNLTSLTSNLNFSTQFYLDSIQQNLNFWYFSDIFLIFFFETKFKFLNSLLFLIEQPQRFLNPILAKKLVQNKLYLKIKLNFNIAKNYLEKEILLGE